MGSLRGWVRQWRVRRKFRRFVRSAVTRGWTTAQLPQSSPLRRGPVLALAPHVDDEAIGCGGALLLHAAQGDTVHVAYVLEDAAQQAARQAEGDRASRMLGAGATHLRCPRDPVAVARALRPLMERIRPAVVYAPWLLDNHESHLVVAHALADVLEQSAPCGEVWGYEVWTPLIPNRIVDITAVLERKGAVLQQYASQLARKDVASMGLGLSRYRAGLLADRAAAAAEVFLALAPQAYVRMRREVSR